MHSYKKFGVSLLTALLLFGCGGGSSGDETASTEGEIEKATEVGIIVDAQINGLRYVSLSSDKKQSKEGVTNAKGEFFYFEGGSVTFYVGNIEIGSTTPEKMVAITTVAKSETESENIARFLQTIDTDSNPDNGITISSTVNENAKSSSISLSFDENFENNFEELKNDLYKDSESVPEIVSREDALEHASKSERLASLNEFDLYKAIANEKDYNVPYYNSDRLREDQRKRVYLWLWERVLSKEMAIEDELQFTKPEFNLDNLEETHDKIQKYLDYADVVTGVSSLGAGAYSSISKAGTRSFGYELAELSSVTVGGCSAVVKLYDTEDSTVVDETLETDDLCTNIVKVLNPAGDSTSAFAAANPVMSSFLPEVFPKLLHAKKMNWIQLNTKSLKSISKLKVAKPDILSIATSIASISNDFYGAYSASEINKELTTRMVAREWLNIWFRSAGDQAYMNMLINDNKTKLVGRIAQIEALGAKWGSSGVLCDTYKFFNPFYDCTGAEHMNFDTAQADSIAGRYLAKSNDLYRNVASLTGPISDEEGEIGVIEINWDEEQLYSENTLVSGEIDFNKDATTAKYIRIVPKIDVDNEQWDGLMCQLDEDLHFGDNCVLTVGAVPEHFLNGKEYQLALFSAIDENWRGSADSIINTTSIVIDDLHTISADLSTDGGQIDFQMSGSTRVVFKADDNQTTISVPSDAWVRLVPTSYTEVDNYNAGINCKVESDGSYESSCYIYPEYKTALDEIVSDSSQTYQLVVYKNHINPSDKHWDCGEDLYKYVGGSETRGRDITVLQSDFQNRSSEECSN